MAARRKKPELAKRAHQPIEENHAKETKATTETTAQAGVLEQGG